MANTYTALFYHIVFSTKNRVETIKPDIENRVWAYIGGIDVAQTVFFAVCGFSSPIHPEAADLLEKQEVCATAPIHATRLRASLR